MGDPAGARRAVRAPRRGLLALGCARDGRGLLRLGAGLAQRSLLRPAAAACPCGAAALWGVSTVLGRYATARVSTFPLTALRFLLALPILVVLYRLQPALERRLPSTPAEAGMLVAMALGPGLAALLLYYRGLRSTIAPVASIAELAFPLTAVALNWIFLDIRLTPAQLAGGVLLLVSVTGLGYFGSGAERPEAPQGGPSIE
ncbi:MAG: hypothetical protein DMG07_16870 [Acidobacteria bacterium]|nr:MAG: hypothetical protein DMG07_16870 [Acidobacteriota bacterium]